MPAVVRCGAVSECCAVARYPVVWCRVEWNHQPKGGRVNVTTEKSEGKSNIERTQRNGDNRTTIKKNGNSAQEDMKLPHHANKRRLPIFSRHVQESLHSNDPSQSENCSSLSPRLAAARAMRAPSVQRRFGPSATLWFVSPGFCHTSWVNMSTANMRARITPCGICRVVGRDNAAPCVKILPTWIRRQSGTVKPEMLARARRHSRKHKKKLSHPPWLPQKVPTISWCSR